MKILNYTEYIFPKAATAVSLLVLPTLLTIYFIVTQYSNRFIIEQNVTYFDVQNNWIGKVFITQQWLEWFNRFMDFAFWGIIALIVLAIGWAISSTKVAVKNHYIQEKFTNFKENKISWHGNFFIVLLLKICLVIIIAYSFFAIIGKQIPQLSASITGVLVGLSFENLLPVLAAFFAIFAYEFVIALAIKLFQHLRAM